MLALFFVVILHVQAFLTHGRISFPWVFSFLLRGFARMIQNGGRNGMIICSGQKLTKSYGGTNIFEDITFDIHEGDRIGLVGRNGSGKSTLLRLLSKMEVIDEGQLHWKKGVKIGYLEQLPSFANEITASALLKSVFHELIEIEKAMKELEKRMASERDKGKLQAHLTAYGKLQDQFTHEGGYEMEAAIDKIVNGLQMEALKDRLFSSLSGGEQTKVGLGMLLLKKPDLLLLDEPTNHLDIRAVEWLESFLATYQGTVVAISHDRYFLDKVVNKIYELEDGELHFYETNFTGYVEEKEKRLLQAFHQYQEQQKKIKKMKEAIKKLKEWANRANPPNEGLHKRARSMEKALEKMTKLDKPNINRKKLTLSFEANHRSGNDVIMLKDVSKSFHNKSLFQDVKMHVRYQERVAIVGDNGSGKSTLVKIMLQKLNPDHGDVKIGSNIKVGYLSQHVMDKEQDGTVLAAFRSQVQVTEAEARHILAKFLFYGHSVFRQASQLSGGERVRLRLAQLMYQDVNVLILDEPTNHLDIESCEVLEEALEKFNGTIIAISHDRYFLNRMFEKIYWIQDQSIQGFAGNYDWAKQKRSELEQQTEVETKRVKKKATFTLKNNKKDLTNTLEAQIEQLEASIDLLAKKLAHEEQLEVLQQLYEEKQQLMHQCEQLYEKLSNIYDE